MVHNLMMDTRHASMANATSHQQWPRMHGFLLGLVILFSATTQVYGDGEEACRSCGILYDVGKQNNAYGQDGGSSIVTWSSCLTAIAAGAAVELFRLTVEWARGREIYTSSVDRKLNKKSQEADVMNKDLTNYHSSCDAFERCLKINPEEPAQCDELKKLINAQGKDVAKLHVLMKRTQKT